MCDIGKLMTLIIPDKPKKNMSILKKNPNHNQIRVFLFYFGE